MNLVCSDGELLLPEDVEIGNLEITLFSADNEWLGGANASDC